MTPRSTHPTALGPDRRRQLLAFLEAIGVIHPARSGAAAAERIDPDLEPIDEALTHTSAGLPRNHERLEFLGDAVLRLAAADHLQRNHPELSVGACSELRAQIVSDRWLAELGESCQIDSVLRLGPLAIGDLAGRRTIRAEACEALMGALYEAWGNLSPVHRWLAPHWECSIAELIADPHRHNWKSALQEWSQAEGMGLPHYRAEERSQRHGDPRRFACWVELKGQPLGEGWGGSRREAEQQAARAALAARPLSPAPEH